MQTMCPSKTALLCRTDFQSVRVKKDGLKIRPTEEGKWADY
jgi:hypothetical protein